MRIWGTETVDTESPCLPPHLLVLFDCLVSWQGSSSEVHFSENTAWHMYPGHLGE